MIDLNEKVIVNLNGMQIYTFCNETNENEALKRAIDAYEEGYIKCNENASDYPTNEEYWINQANEYRKANFVIMTYDEFIKKEREYYLSLPLHEITKDKFHEMLEVLPPYKWVTINGTNEFLISEFWSGNYTDQYARKNGKYYSKLVDALDQSTWIHNLI
jgi:hypothetical protein